MLEPCLLALFEDGEEARARLVAALRPVAELVLLGEGVHQHAVRLAQSCVEGELLCAAVLARARVGVRVRVRVRLRVRVRPARQG